MTAPSDDGSGAGGGGTDSAGAPPPAAEAEAPPEASPDAPAPADEEPAPEQDAPADATTTSEPAESEPADAAPADGEPADAAPADDGNQSPESGGAEQPGQEAPAAGGEEDVPGTIPGGQMRETDAPGEGAGEEQEAEGILPLDDEFATTVRNEGPNLETPAGILDDLGQQWNGTGGDADAAHADGSGGVAAVRESWQDPAQEELRRRTDSSLEETRGVGDSARAMDEQVRRAGEQVRAATDAIEQNTARQAPGYYLATSTLPPGERDVAARRIVDITVDGNRDIANQAAANIMNDPGWDRVEAPPTPGAGDPTPALYAAGSGALDAGANLLAERHASTVAAQGLDDVAPKVLKAGKVAGGALGLPLAIASAAHDAHAGPPDERESLVQAAASNGAGLLASIAAPAAAGAVAGAVGGAGIGAIPGALIGIGAGVIASGAVDSLFENGFSDPGGALLDGVNSLGDTASSLVDAAESADAAINSKIREAWNALF